MSDMPLRIANRLQRNADGHLLWTGPPRKEGGYGVVWYEGRLWRIHRLVYFLAKGTLSDDVELHHRDDCPKLCAEPEHMTELSKEAHASLEHKGKNYSTCRKGHDRSNARIRYGPEGQIWFVCRLCKKEKKHERYAP